MGSREENVLWCRSSQSAPGCFDYFAEGPGIHPCVLSSLGQYIHILDGLKVALFRQKLLNTGLRLTLIASSVCYSRFIFSMIKVGQMLGLHLKAYSYKF